MAPQLRKRFSTNSHRARPRLLSLESREAPAVFTVLNANDSGAGSLRDALTQANQTVAADTINFDPTFFNTQRTITLLTALPNISQDVSILGPGANLLTVQSGAFRNFYISVAGKTGNVTISGVTLNGGTAPAGQIGGNIFTDDSLTLTNSVITGGSSAAGGGVGTATYATLTIRNCTISGNTSSGLGGGVFVGQFGSLVISDSTVANNTGTVGGGIALRADNTLLMERCTVSGNTATGTGGGGIYTLGQPYASGIVVNNSTIANNSASSGIGGGVLDVGTTGQGYANTISFNNTTIAGNSAALFGGGIARSGAGSTGAINLTGTVVARNSAFGGGADIQADGTGPINANNSLVFDQTNLTLTGTGNLPAGTDPLFVGGATPTLANNGGNVQTIALQSGSPLINAGLNAAVSGVDARGNGFSRTQGPAADIGSYEFAPTPGIPSALASAADVTSNGGTTYTFTVTYTDIAGTNIGINTASLGSDDVTVTGPNSFTANATFVSSTGSGGSVTATYSITPPGGSFDAADYGAYRIAINSGAVTDLDGNAVPVVSAGSARFLTPATFTVTNLNDTGAGSLRDALNQANARSFSQDVINFQAGLTGTINLASTLFIADPVNITGPGASSITLAGNNSFRLMLTVMEGQGNVAISGLTMTGGRATSTNIGGGALFLENDNVTLNGVVMSGNTSTNGPGGAIGAQRGAVLTIRNSTLSGNSAPNTASSYVGNGGAIGMLLDGGTLTIDNSTISGNNAGFSGGGVSDRSGGILTIRNSTISGNTCVGGSGGGVYMGYNGSILLDGSTISGNTANGAAGGGGFYFFGHTDPRGLVIRNSTISGNTATTTGGGVALVAFNGYGPVVTSTLLIQNSTIAGNTSGGAGGGFSDTNNQGGTTTMVSSVIANNNGSAAAPDVSGTINASFSLVRNQTGATLPNYATQNNLPAGTDPLFVGGATPTLANNGGPTQTIALQPNSPLINAGSNPANVTGDQRGIVGFVRSFGNAPDIGSFEFQPPLATVVNGGEAQRSRVTSLTITFAGQVTFNGPVASAFTLTRNSDGAVITFTATASTVNGVTQVVLDNFTGTATQSGSLADGRYTLTALSSQINLGGQPIDGDGNGTAGGNYTFGDPQGLFRYFGDINGSRSVDIADFGLFTTTFGLNSNSPAFIRAFDFNNDGVIDIADFGQFAIRMFTTLP